MTNLLYNVMEIISEGKSNEISLMVFFNTFIILRLFAPQEIRPNSKVQFLTGRAPVTPQKGDRQECNGPILYGSGHQSFHRNCFEQFTCTEAFSQLLLIPSTFHFFFERWEEVYVESFYPISNVTLLKRLATHTTLPFAIHS